MTNKMTEQQEKAIKYVESPLLIVAGPGTGKTRVIIEKIKYLIENGFDPNRILVSTFTIKAADELKDRLRLQLGDKVESMQISTIHSFCHKMLQSFPEYHNFGNIFDVLGELDQFLYVNRNYWNYGLRDYINEINVEELINFYNKCTENNVNPKELIKYYEKNNSSKKELAIAKSYKIYLDMLLDPNDTKLDYALLQREFYFLLQNNPDVLNQVREMYDYILIDEYQDTNPIQDAIFKLIAEPKYNITVVGDEDQSIYGFRGASINNFRTFLDRYPGAKKLELEENFRSNKEIVSCFDKFMKPHRTFKKRIFTNNPGFSNPILMTGESPQEEAKNISLFILKLVSNHNVKYEDIAILFKSVRYHSSFVIDELDRNSIPSITIGDSSLLTKDEIKDTLILLGYLNSYEFNDFQKKWLFDHNIFESEYLGLEENTIQILGKNNDINNILDSLDHDKLEKMQIPKKDIEILLSLKNLKKQQTRNQISQLKLFYKLLDATQYNYRLFRRYLVDKDANADIKIRNLAKLSNLIFSIEENTRSREFKSFFYHLDSIPENKMEDAASFEEIDAVKLMTIHQAKGLEFPVVILAGVTSRRYNREQKEEESLIEIPAELMLDKYKFDRGEEIQRTFYVGLSRAEKILAISTIDGKRTKPSAFIEEIGKDKFINPEEFNENFSDDDHYQRSKEKTKLSYSSISAYINCPFRFFCRDCLGFQTPEDYFQEYGIILHNSLKKIHVLIKEGKAINIEDIMSISDMYCKDDESKKKWRDELIMDLYNYYEKTQEFIGNILDVEIPFSYINKDVVVNGQADLIIKNKKGDIQIIDYKSRNIVGFEKINVDTQLRLYNIALQNRYGNQIKKIGAYTVKDNILTWFNNDDKELENTKELVAVVSDSIDNKNFKRKWQGKTCNTQTGKCEFYYICNNLEEDAKNV